MPALTVGFDLDMTLIDSRPGIAAVMAQLSAETGVAIDTAAVTSRLGPPLDDELRRWFPEERVAAVADRYRELYPSVAVPATLALQGAHSALDAVRRAGGRSVVVTAKYGPNASLNLEALGLAVDAVHGWLFAERKGEALRAESADIYVGDHVADVLGARAAGALSVAVATGPVSADELRAAGADVVLDDLTQFGPWLEGHLLSSRLDVLHRQLQGYGGLMVAYSGGADSAFLLAAAVRALGPGNVVAATAVSDALASTELERAAALARSLGVVHLTPGTDEMAREGYRVNGGDRCYFCKAELLDVLTPLAVELGLAHVATGTNADDAVAGFRPGIRAAAERGAATPLRDAGLTKSQVRAASRTWGLPTWDKPATPCLSSRVAYGVEITPSRLARVDRAETALRAALSDAGIVAADLRVRDLGGEPSRARVEVGLDVLAQVAAYDGALAAVRGAGFAEAELDPRGFRSGSLNELLG